MDVWPMVQQLIAERVQLGLDRYGTVLETNNGRSALLDAIHEAADLLMYLTQEYFERYGEAPSGMSQ